MKKSVCGILASSLILAGILTACSGGGAVESSAEKAETAAKAESSETETSVKTESKETESESGKSEEAENTASAKGAEQEVYVGADYVKDLLDGKLPESKDFVLLEAAWSPEKEDKDYQKAHIPGAVHMNTDDVESDKDWNYRSPEEIGKLMKRYGITKDTTVLVYGNSPENAADDRVAVMLLWAGVKNVKDLSGGIDAWKKAGYETETKANEPKGTDQDFGLTIPAHPEYILSIDEVKEKLKDDPKFKLVSIRSKDEFLGKTSGYSYIDRAGEPLGAIWGHDTDDKSYNNADGTIAGVDTLEKYLKESGASLEENDLAFYCGTGWRACVPFLIAYQSGYRNVYLFDGGWFVWQMDKDNPVQLGEPGSSDYKEVKVSDLATDKAKLS